MQEALEAALSPTAADDSVTVGPEETGAQDGGGAMLQEDDTLDEELNAASGAPLWRQNETGSYAWCASHHETAYSRHNTKAALLPSEDACRHWPGKTGYIADVACAGRADAIRLPGWL